MTDFNYDFVIHSTYHFTKCLFSVMSSSDFEKKIVHYVELISQEVIDFDTLIYYMSPNFLL